MVQTPYLYRIYLLQEEMYRAMWEKATDEALEKLVAVSAKGLTFIGQRRHVGGLVGKMEHLACYFPGNLALGVAQVRAWLVGGIQCNPYGLHIGGASSLPPKFCSTIDALRREKMKQ